MYKDLIQEADRILSEARNREIVLRLIGGLAIKYHCPSSSRSSLRREYPDIDLMGLSNQAKRIKTLFADLSYKPRDIFNRLYGHKRLIFHDLENMRRIDLFLDFFQMCHKFNFRNRLSLDKLTLTPSDLLVMKLQIVQENEKDLRDMITLLLDHEVADSEAAERINVGYIARLCAEDWGIYRTFTQNLNQLRLSLDSYELDGEEKEAIKTRLSILADRIEKEPKSMKWKLRARVGDRASWYEEVEPDKPLVGVNAEQKSVTAKN